MTESRSGLSATSVLDAVRGPWSKQCDALPEWRGQATQGFGKVRYPGRQKNAPRAFTALALVNIYLSRERLMAGASMRTQCESEGLQNRPQRPRSGALRTPLPGNHTIIGLRWRFDGTCSASLSFSLDIWRAKFLEIYRSAFIRLSARSALHPASSWHRQTACGCSLCRTAGCPPRRSPRPCCAS